MTILELKSLQHSINLLETFSIGNIYHDLMNILSRYKEIDKSQINDIINVFHQTIDSEFDKVTDAKEWIKTVVNNK